MIRKIFTIVIPVLAITAAILLFGIKVYNDSYSTFREDGFVLGIAEGKDANRYYFLKENKYKVNESKNEVVFVNTEDEEITIPNDTFVHYTDGSVATFKKAVVLNLPNVKNSTLQYYNVYEGSVFSKVSDGHQIDYLDQKLAFKDFMVKITEDKYMIVGSDLNIKYGDEEKTISDGFIEIEYLDGNIIKITNQELNVQNISKDLSVTVDGITVDLLNKKILYNGEIKANLGEITIDSDDNIEIIPDDEAMEEIEDDSLSVEHFENQPVTAPNVNIGGMQSGVVDTSTKRPDEVVQENETVPDPEFDVQGITVTVKSVNVSVKIKDEAGVLTGDVSWKIVENATNLIVCMGTIAHGNNNFGFDCGNLAPETNYSVVIRSAYKKNEVNYEKDFVQKTFVTKSMGLIIDKDYVRTNEIGYLITVNGTSTIKSFKYDLIGPEGALISGQTYTLNTPADNGEKQEIPLVFKTEDHYKIRSNSSYTLKIYNIIYGNEELSNTYFVSKKVKTLKTTPTFGDTAYAINKQSSKFVLYLNNIKDPDNGAINYRADIYEVGKESTKADIITTREATTSSSIDIDVDGTVISRNTNYRAKLYLTFYDNEMEYEIYLGSEDMIMNSIIGPSVLFTSEKITHEKIEGKLTINDSNETINLEKPLDIIIQNRSVGTSSISKQHQVEIQTLPNRKSFTIPINENGLKSNTSYLFTIMGWVNYNDENGYIYSEIGTFWVNTALPTKLAALISDMTGDPTTTTQFKINFKLGVTEADTQGENPNEINTMVNIKFRVRSQDYDSSMPCIATNRCWEQTFADTNSNAYESTLKGMFFDNEYEFTPTTFNIDEADLTYGNYIFEVVGAYDYTEHQNDLPIVNKSLNFNPNASAESVIKNKIFTETRVLNNKAIVNYQDETLKENTVIGYKLIPDIIIPNLNRAEYKIEYTIKNLSTNKTHVVKDSEITKLYTESVNDGNNAIAILFKDVDKDGDFEYKRGNAYAFKYCVTYNIGVAGETEQTACTPNFKALKIENQPYKQMPEINVYLKTRDTSANQKWQYYINDVDNALAVDKTLGKTGKYGTTTSSSWSSITCGDDYKETKNCLANTSGTFQTKLAAGALIVKTSAVLLEGAVESTYGIVTHEEEIKFVNEMIFYNIVNNIDVPKYKIEFGESGNDIKIYFSAYTLSIMNRYVAHVKLQFTTPDGTTAIIYKDLDNKDTLNAENAVLSVDFSEISALMKKGTITPKISFVYDRELGGFETTDLGEGFAFEENVNGVIGYQTFDTKYKVFKNINLNYETGELTFTDIKGNTGSKFLSKSSKGLYYENSNGEKAYVQAKVLTSKEVTCLDGATCTFKFDNIKPTFYLDDEDIDNIIGGVRFQPTLIVDESLKNGLKLITRLYKQEEGVCSTEVAKQYEYSYGTEIYGNAEFQIEDLDLDLGQTYCMNFTYLESDSNPTEYDFFYGAIYHNAGNPDRRTYVFTTLAKPTITNFNIRYDIGTIRSNSTAWETAVDTARQHDTYNRSLTATFSVDTLENYDGFDFSILDENLNVVPTIDNIKQTLQPIIKDETKSTYTVTLQLDSNIEFQTLLANTVYYFSIIAYQNCESGDECDLETNRRLLESTENKFTFYINKPTVKIQRVDYGDDEMGEFSIQVTINDRYRAVGGYSLSSYNSNTNLAEYSIDVMTDLGLQHLDTIKSKNAWYRTSATSNPKLKNIDLCVGSTLCTIQVNYNADLTNSGIELNYVESKDIAIGTSADIGKSSIINTSTSGVRIGYTDSYMITSIAKIDYTVTSNATGASNSFTDVSTGWATDDTNTYYYLDINIPLTSGTYILEVSYKDASGKLVASESYDIIIG